MRLLNPTIHYQKQSGDITGAGGGGGRCTEVSALRCREALPGFCQSVSTSMENYNKHISVKPQVHLFGVTEFSFCEKHPGCHRMFLWPCEEMRNSDLRGAGTAGWQPPPGFGPTLFNPHKWSRYHHKSFVMNTHHQHHQSKVWTHLLRQLSVLTFTTFSISAVEKINTWAR